LSHSVRGASLPNEELCRIIRNSGSGIIADNLSKAGWSWAVYQRLIPTGKQFLLLTPIVMTERFVVHADEKLTAFLELESAMREAELTTATRCRACI
jgi:hypothetical protein